MICIILGTRPEIIKMSPLIRECEKRGLDYFVIHSGQHYSFEMDKAFFEDLNLPEPEYNLDVGSGTQGGQTAKILTGIENVLMGKKPDVVLVQGDTNTVMAGALAASKLHIKVGHVEAGLRSFDRRMPEEINRVVADHISDYLFAPTGESEKNLIAEGIPDEKVFVTGNTVVDAVYQNLEISNEKSDIIDSLGLESGKYLLVTAHRAENVDDKVRLSGIINGINAVSEKYSLPAVFPMHPRTEKMMKEFGISPGGIRIIKPAGYLDFLQLEANARLILTDSGGLQEESCILGVPCVTLRDNTERPETVECGGNVLAGTESERIVEAADKMINFMDCRETDVSGSPENSDERLWENPFGDGKTSERIIDICLKD
jgi:UDP-N-acetylglucosamine 2-epimerase (non-hydrolysing)